MTLVRVGQRVGLGGGIPFFYCRDWRGVTMPGFGKFYVVWNEGVRLDLG